MAKNEKPKQEELEKDTETVAEPTETEKALAALAEEHEQHLRLAAEYDNFRKRSQKEREALYVDIKAETAGKFLPVFDNLLRAVEQETADEAYKKGVEMTMAGFREVMEKLGVTEYGQVGDSFDPALHNAVMHTEDENFGENTICEVFQKGFKLGDKVIRFAMVRVAN
jgi:molecular chaperone GrpE